MVAGDDEISTYKEGTEQYPVKIRVLESQRRDLDAISKLMVPSSRAGLVRIDPRGRPPAHDPAGTTDAPAQVA